MNDNYEGPVRLQREIPWHRRDRATAAVLFKHMEIANPPMVIPWSPKRKKTADLLDRYNVHPATLRDLRVMFERARKFSDGMTFIEFTRYISNAFERMGLQLTNSQGAFYPGQDVPLLDDLPPEMSTPK